MSDKEKAKKRILDSYRNMSSQDFVFHLVELGKKHQAHYNCPHCRGQDLQSELDRLRKREKILVDAIKRYADTKNWQFSDDYYVHKNYDCWVGDEDNGYDLANDALKRISDIDA